MELGTLEELEAQFAKLAHDLEPALLDPNATRVALKRIVAIKQYAEALEVLLVQRVDSSGTWASTGHRSLGSFIAAVTGTSVGAANRLCENASVIAGSPVVEEAMRAGQLSAPKLAEVCKGVKAAPDKAAHLVDTARRHQFGGLRDEVKRVIAAANPAELEAAHKKARDERHLRWWTEGQVGHIKYEGPLDQYAAIVNELEHETRRVFRQARRDGQRKSHAAYTADALYNLIVEPDDTTADEPAADEAAAAESAAATGMHADEPQATDGTTADEPAADQSDPATDGAAEAAAPEADGNSATGSKVKSRTKRKRKRRRARHTNVNVLVSLDALRRGEVRDGEVCEIPGVGPIPVSIAREYLGDAFVTAIIRDGKDIRTVVHLGRYIPTEIRTALPVEVRECVEADCQNRGYIENDHDQRYTDGGPTALENLQPACRHHQVLKEKGWTFGPADPVTGERKMYPPGVRPPAEYD